MTPGAMSPARAAFLRMCLAERWYAALELVAALDAGRTWSMLGNVPQAVRERIHAAELAYVNATRLAQS